MTDPANPPIRATEDVAIRIIQAPVFLGTKLEAFHGRGGGDYLFSHDLGDTISMVDGRDSLLGECGQMPEAFHTQDPPARTRTTNGQARAYDRPLYKARHLIGLRSKAMVSA